MNVFEAGFQGLFSTRSTTDAISVDDDKAIAVFGIRRALIIWHRVASIRLVHRNRQWAGTFLMAWREFSFRCRLQRVAFVDRLALICRRWRLLSCFRSLVQYVKFQKLSNVVLRTQLRRRTMHAFNGWKKLNGHNRKLMKCRSALFKYFVIGSVRHGLYLWRVKVMQARRIDQSISIRQALQYWRAAYLAVTHRKQALKRRTVRAWHEWLLSRKRTNQHYLNRTQASLSLAKRMILAYNDVLSGAFLCWLHAMKASKQRSTIETRRNSITNYASTSVSNAVDRSKMEIALIRSRLMQNRDHFLVQSVSTLI